MNIVILLTCTVNTQPHISWLKQRDSNERLEMYLNSIIKWLNKTKLQIVVIENSGIDLKNELINKFPDFNVNRYLDRFESITYNYDAIPTEDKQFLDSHEAKGHHELYAINYAHLNSKLIKECNYVIKITGRYFVTNLENILENNLKHDETKIKFIRQSLKWRGWNRCEVLGCYLDNFNELFNYPSENDMVEEEYTNRVNNILKNRVDYRVFELPVLKLDKPTKQGVGKLMKNL